MNNTEEICCKLLFESKMKNYTDKFELFLSEYLLSIKGVEKGLMDSIKYSLAGGGKRIRPVIMLAFYDLCGGKPDEIYKFALALEMLHTYSLIHDDLPCMDNDTVRRGKPCNHIVFSESTALLAGDALITQAFEAVSGGFMNNFENTLKCINILASCAGSSGMVSGQYMDLNGTENFSCANKLLKLYELKTASLFVSAAQIGATLAGGDKQKVYAAGEYAKNLGFCFQLVDDLNDGDTKTLNILNDETAKIMIDDFEKKSEYWIEKFEGDTSFLKALMSFLSREYNAKRKK